MKAFCLCRCSLFRGPPDGVCPGPIARDADDCLNPFLRLAAVIAAASTSAAWAQLSLGGGAGGSIRANALAIATMQDAISAGATRSAPLEAQSFIQLVIDDRD